MPHQIAGYKLGRSTGQRKALYRSLVRSLLIHERIRTTETKAKAVQRWADQIITLGKKGELRHRKQALAFITDEEVIKKLFDDLAKRYSDRPGGYTRILKLGPRRGDGADMALLELVERPEG